MARLKILTSLLTTRYDPRMNTKSSLTSFSNPSSVDMRDWVVCELENLKAISSVALDVSKYPTIAEYIVIASGTSLRHLQSMAQNLVVTLKARGLRPLSVQSDMGSEWVLVDFGSVIVHLMHPRTREFYDLEALWSTDTHAVRA